MFIAQDSASSNVSREAAGELPFVTSENATLAGVG
jgi:hypothetical protein